MNDHVFGESTPGREHSSTNSARLRLSGARFLTSWIAFPGLHLSMLGFQFDQIFCVVCFVAIWSCLISYRTLLLLKSQKSNLGFKNYLGEQEVCLIPGEGLVLLPIPRLYVSSDEVITPHT